MPEPDAPDPVTDELLALIKAQGDQAKAQVSEFAAVIVTFHRALTDGGIGSSTADQMAYQYFVGLLIAAGRATLNG